MTEREHTPSHRAPPQRDQGTVGTDEEALRLDRWFKRHHPGMPHALLARLARTGRLRVDGNRVVPGTRLKAGQTISWPRTDHVSDPSPPRAPVSRREAARLHRLVIHCDDAVLVLNKPSGLATQGGSGLTHHIDGGLDALRRGYSHAPRLVHRLDKDTSGILVLGRTASAAAALAEKFRTHQVEKIYWALLCRSPRPAQGRIDLAVLKKKGQSGRERMVEDAQGQRALTLYQTMETTASHAAWVALKPLTGRTHQLRVHCASMGCPIQGDRKYGDRRHFLRGNIATKLHLHAREIRLPHPDGGVLHICAPLDGHMAESWNYLGLNPNAATPPFVDENVKNNQKKSKHA